MDNPTSQTTSCLRSELTRFINVSFCIHNFLSPGCLDLAMLSSLMALYLSQILQLLQWLDRFWDVCSTLPADSQGISVLSLHWQWVQKHLIVRLPQLLLGDNDATFG